MATNISDLGSESKRSAAELKSHGNGEYEWNLKKKNSSVEKNAVNCGTIGIQMQVC